MADNNKNFKMSAKRACGDKPDIVNSFYFNNRDNVDISDYTIEQYDFKMKAEIMFPSF